MPLNFLSSFLRAVWIGLCALAMLKQTCLLFGLPPASWYLAGFVFGGAVFGYHFTQPDPLRRVLAWALFLLAAVCFWKMPVFARWVALVPLAVWGVYYGFRRPGNAGLRARPALKPLAIAVAWAWVTVLLPLEAGQWAAAMVLFVGRSAFIFALALAYDLVDLEYDRRFGLDTLALRRGTSGTFKLIDRALMLSGACVVLNFLWRHYTLEATIGLLLSLAGSAVLLRWVLQRIKMTQQKYWIDGLMVMQYGLVYWAMKGL